MKYFVSMLVTRPARSIFNILSGNESLNSINKLCVPFFGKKSENY